MNVYTSIDFAGVWPVGASAVIVAENETQAEQLLRQALKGHGLSVRGDETVDLVDVSKCGVTILQDGDY